MTTKNRIEQMMGDVQIARYDYRYGHRYEVKGIPSLEGVKMRSVTGIIGHLAKQGLTNWLENNVHAAVDAYATDGTWDDHPEVEPALLAFKEFLEEHRLSVASTETLVFSEKWRVGGTTDLVAFGEEGRCVLVDFKTSSKQKVYDNHIIQLAAYEAMLGETEQLPSIYRRGVLFLPVGSEGWTWCEVTPEQANAGLTAMNALVSLDVALKEML
jgi:hypothetical protein